VAPIVPTVQIYASSSGRMGCSTAEYLCIGSTNQPGLRKLVMDLAQLDYVTDIEVSVPE
jgi:hypothetical protein